MGELGRVGAKCSRKRSQRVQRHWSQCSQGEELFGTVTDQTELSTHAVRRKGGD